MAGVKWTGLVLPSTCENPNAAAQKAFRDFRLPVRRLVITRRTNALIAASVEQIKAYRSSQAQEKAAKRSERRLKKAAAALNDIPPDILAEAESQIDIRELNRLLLAHEDVIIDDSEHERFSLLIMSAMRTAALKDLVDTEAVREAAAAAESDLRRYMKMLRGRR